MKNLTMFKKLCGPGALRNVFLTTTQWSKVDQAAEEIRESGLCGDRNFWGLLIEKGATVQRFHGTRESGLKLIDKLMPKQPEVLDIQEQIVTQGRTIVETDAGQWINAELIAQEKKYKEEIETLERERQEAIKEKDDEMKELLAEEQAKARERLEKSAAEKRHLEEMHAEEMRKRDLEKQRDEERTKEELRKAQAKFERAEAEKRRQEELHREELRKEEEREKRRQEELREAQAKFERAEAEKRMQEELHREELRRKDREERERREAEPHAAQVRENEEGLGIGVNLGFVKFELRFKPPILPLPTAGMMLPGGYSRRG